MKSIMKFTAIASLLLLTNSMLAKEPEFNIVAKGESKSVILTLDTQLVSTGVKIIDKNQNVIYKEKIDESHYSKKFDFNKLEKGEYAMEIENSLKTIVYTIEVGDSTLVIQKKEEKTKPIIRRVGDKVFLNLLNLEEKEVNIKIMDSQNRVVYSETLEGKNIVEKAFNFEKAENDRYVLLVKNNTVTYSESILVK